MDLLKNKYIQFFIVIAIFIFFVYWYKDRINEKKGRTASIDTNALTKKNSFYVALAVRLRNAIMGFSNVDREDSMTLLNELNDDEFKKIYNEYNVLVSPPSTLRSDVAGEFMLFTRIDEEILERMTKLNLG